MDKHELSEAFFSLSQLVERLRGKDGCPWDALQTDSTIRIYLLEEAYEVLDAIEKGSPENICKELGDLLFQILFLAFLAEERGEFDILEVIKGITKKMINRHPHVFGDTKVGSPAEVSDNWAKIKRREKGASEKISSTLKDVPIDIPGLLRAHRLMERASKAGFETGDMDQIMDKAETEFRKLKQDIQQEKKGEIGADIGDLIFSLINLARCWDHNAEDLIRRTNQKFLKNFEEMETEIEALGMTLTDASPEIVSKTWDKTLNKEG